MAKLTILFVMLIMYIAIRPTMGGEIAPQPANNGDALAPSPDDDWEDFELAPSPIDAYLEQCVKSFNESCGSEIFESIFINTTVTARCCKDLVHMGKPCHDVLVRRILDLPWIRREVNVPEVLSHSDEIWNKCVLDGADVFSTSPSPSSF